MSSHKKQFDPLSEENLTALFEKHNSNEDAVLDEIREQMLGLEADPENSVSNGDIQGIVEAFALQRGSTKPVVSRKAMSYKGFNGEAAREAAMRDFQGYGEELDKKVWKENSTGHQRTLKAHQQAREFLAAYDPKLYGGK